MIPAPEPRGETPDRPGSGPQPPPSGRWREALANGVSDIGELLRLVGLEDHPAMRRQLAMATAGQFPLRVPRGFISRMRPGDPNDPLLLQVLPAAAEGRQSPGYVCDPLGEAMADAELPRGLLHKYRTRALLVVVGACAIHCRYCFRRHFPYGERQLGLAWREALDYIASRPEIEEVILSGGDPLSAPDTVLADLAAELDRIPHLKRLRIHSRLPVVLPERVGGPLLDWLAGGRLRRVLVTHANHPNEIDDKVRQALATVHARGILVLNQAVLLRGINDRAEILCRLSEALFAAQVLPYYLHLLDPVAGAAHFAVSREQASRLLWEVSAQLPGYLVPKLVREVPGQPAKVPIAVGPEPAS